jgi:FlaA1/EpsC-like NDP-sugar epimerase
MGMMRPRPGVLPTSFLAARDILLINVGFGVAWFLRYQLELGREVATADYLPWGDYAGISLLLTACLLLIYRLNGVYGRRRRLGWIDEVSGLASGALLGVAIMIVAIFYFRPFGYSRLVFLYAALVIVSLLSFARAVDRAWQDHLRRKGIGLTRVLVVGEGPLGRMIMQNLVAQPELGFQVVGFVDDDARPSLGRISYLGPCGKVSYLVSKFEIDEVIIALPSALHQKINEILVACARQKVGFRIVPDFYELALNQVDIMEINGIPLIGLREPSLRGSGQIL